MLNVKRKLKTREKINKQLHERDSSLAPISQSRWIIPLHSVILHRDLIGREGKGHFFVDVYIS